MALQMGRVFPVDVPGETVMAAKRQWAWADARLAARREWRGAPAPVALVPRAGWSPFFDDLHTHLAVLGVTVRTGCTARVAVYHGRVRAVVDDEVCEGLLVWAANPVPLSSRLGHDALDNAFVPSTNVHARVMAWRGVTPLYVQWHDATSPLLRVYLYEWGGERRACLECYGSLDADEAGRVAQEAMAGMDPWGGGLRLSDLVVERHRRHHLLTAADVTRLRTLELVLDEGDAVGGAWTDYGREQKLAVMAGRLVRLGLLDADRLD
jgi:hypothetical protein